MQQSMPFKSRADRFENNDLMKKASMPGPGAYDVAGEKPEFGTTAGPASGFGMRGKGLDATNNLFKSKMNPPSIPSHKNIYGYDEDDRGQLIKQQAISVGFSGLKNDKVGPGDYDPTAAMNMLRRSQNGVVPWKQATEKPIAI